MEPFSYNIANVLLLGDSLTQQGTQPDGWVNLLSTYLTRRADVFNRGFSGYNTDWVLEILPRILDSVPSDKPPALTTLLLGANDAADASLNPKQHVPLDRYQANLEQIMSAVHDKYGVTAPLVVFAPPPVHAKSWEEYLRSRHGPGVTVDRSNQMAGEYAQACESAVAGYVGARPEAKNAVAFVNLWKIMNELPEELEALLSDGVHFTKLGNQVVFDSLVAVLENQFSNLTVKANDPNGKLDACGSTSGLLPFGPWWNFVDEKDVQGSLAESSWQ